jgi:hypothetical protein
MRFVATARVRAARTEERARAWLFATTLVWSDVYAGRPMATDDASLIESKACQLEIWTQRNQDGDEYWAVPACNVSGNLELALGGARLDAPGDARTVGVAQGKTLFKPLQTNGWGVGLVFGDRFRAGHLNGELYSFVPISFSFRGDRLLLHTNLGWRHQDEDRRDGKRHRMTWGIGSEGQVAQHTFVSAETFGENQGNPQYQVGIRQWLAPNRVQLDATYGNRFGRHDQHWFSIGLKLVTKPFLP